MEKLGERVGGKVEGYCREVEERKRCQLVEKMTVVV